MGGEYFQNYVSAGAEKIGSAKEAFDFIHERAFYHHGHAGCTGTIAEKNGFVIRSPAQYSLESARNFADQDLEDHDKWGPAYCVKVSLDGDLVGWLFYGIASS